MPRITQATRQAQSKKIVTPVKRSASKNKKKPQVKKQQTKNKLSNTSTSKKTKVIKKKQASNSVVIPTVEVDLEKPLAPSTEITTIHTIATTNYKSLPIARSRSKVWLAVTATSAIIMVVWLYFLQHSWQKVPQSVTEAVENSNVEALVNDIKKQFSTVKSSTQTLDKQIQPMADLTTVMNTNSNASGDLNNLFSDIQQP